MKNLKSKALNILRRSIKILIIIMGIAITAYLLSLLMVLLVTFIPEARFFLMDKDGYYNVTLIGTLIAGIALIINTNEVARKAKEEQKRYEKDRINERERYNRETRRQLEKDRIDRLHRTFYNYYNILCELALGFDEINECLEGILRIEKLSRTDTNMILSKEDYIKRLHEAINRVNPEYKSRIWMASKELAWQIQVDKEISSDTVQKLGKTFKEGINEVSNEIQTLESFKTEEIPAILRHPHEIIETCGRVQVMIRDLLLGIEKNYQNYLDAELEHLKLYL